MNLLYEKKEADWGSFYYLKFVKLLLTVILIIIVLLCFTGCSSVRTYCCWWTFGAEVQEAVDNIGEIPDRPPIDRSGGVSLTEVEPDMVTLYFAFDESHLRPESIEYLRGLGSWLRRNENVRIRIKGHTCDIGEADYNVALGERRARTARQFLVDMGVASTRIEIVSMGEEQPASLNRNLNRRDDFFVIER